MANDGMRELRSGTKVAKLDRWVRKQFKDDTKFLFTSDDAHKLIHKLSAKGPEEVWNTLVALEKHGRIKRTRRKGKRGIIVSLVHQDRSVTNTPKRQKTLKANNRQRGRSTRKAKAENKTQKSASASQGYMTELQGENNSYAAEITRLGELIKLNNELIEKITKKANK
jgi:hypothetical protein